MSFNLNDYKLENKLNRINLDGFLNLITNDQIDLLILRSAVELMEYEDFMSQLEYVDAEAVKKAKSLFPDKGEFFERKAEILQKLNYIGAFNNFNMTKGRSVIAVKELLEQALRNSEKKGEELCWKF